jgi:hypothetical protein
VQAAKTLTISAPLREVDDYLAHVLAFVSTFKLTKVLHQRVDALEVIRPTAATLARAVDAAEPEALWVDDERAALEAELAAVGN